MRTRATTVGRKWNAKHSSRKLLPVCLGLSVCILASLACALPTNSSSGSVEATQLALEVEATNLALQKIMLTQEAESQEESAAPPQAEEPAADEETADATPTSTVEAEESSGAVEGSLERAAYDPAYGWGSGHDSDDFEGATGKFPSSSAGAATAWYGDGRYNITFTSRNRWTWYWSFLDVKDFYADVVVFNGDQCVSGDTAGLLFRGDSDIDMALMFGVSCGGEYFVGATVMPGAEGPVCSWSENGDVACGGDRVLFQSDLIQTGPGAINRIGVWAKGLDLNFYINGKWVASRKLSVGTSFPSGKFALYLGTAQSTNASVSFDDFNAWYLD